MYAYAPYFASWSDVIRVLGSAVALAMYGAKSTTSYGVAIDGTTRYFDGAAIEADLSAVAAEIDRSLAAQYALPLTQQRAIDAVRGMAEILEKEQCYLRSPGADVPAAVTEAAKRVRAELRALAQGTVRLPGIPVPEAADEGTIAADVYVSDGDPQMTRTKLAGW